MCGIFAACLSQKREQQLSAGQLVLEGLKRLEYRGYDSWGVAVVTSNKLEIEKHAGQIGEVQTPLPLPASTVGLGHTRWATHGGVSDRNAHPHLASTGAFALVQNGVVENYQTLKKRLSDEGYVFKSETDTEVIVGLIEDFSQKRREKLHQQKTANVGLHTEELVSLADVLAAFAQCQGRNTIAVLTKDGAIWAVRQGSPLILARSKDGDYFLSSDVLSLGSVATEYFPVANGQTVIIEPGQVAQVVMTHTQEPVKLKFTPIEVSQLQLGKKEYQYFMRKEMYEQATVLAMPLQNQPELWKALSQKLKTANSIYTVGSGSADFVSQQLAFELRQVGLPAQAVKAYEARSFQKLFKKGDLCIAVSQSGETADTIEVLEWMKAAGVTISSIVNMPGSTITALSELPFMLQIGPEVGIASTKAVTGAIIWAKAVATYYQSGQLHQLETEIERYQHQLHEWLSEFEANPAFLQLVQDLKNVASIFVLGRGQLYAPALEFSLKMKEISYVHSESFSGGELKHGVIALIEQGTPVFCLLAQDLERADMLNAAAQVKARGAKVIGVAAEDNELFDTWLPTPKNPDFAAISAILPSQLLTYHLALAKGLDPDRPRNLAKSVTVK